MNAGIFRGISTITALLLTYSLCFLSQQTATNGTMLTQGYHLLKKIPVGGEGRWDYLTLDSTARRLYVTRSTRVMVLDVDTGLVVGEVPNTAGVHGVAIAPELGRGFTSNGKAATASIFDLKTLRVLGQVKTGSNPDAIVYEPSSQKVLTFNGESNSATIFNAKNGKVLGTIELGGQPESAVADGLGRVYVNLENKSEVLALDASSTSVKARFPLAPCTEPTGIAMDRQHRRLFVSCKNQLMAVMDADSGRIEATVPIGSGADATSFDPATGLAFSSNGSGTLTVVHEDSPDKFSVVGSVATQRGARTMALDLKTHNVFLATAQFGSTPAPIPGQRFVRPKIVPGSFVILVLAR